MKFQFKNLSTEDVSQIVVIENQSFREPWSDDAFRNLVNNTTFESMGIFVGSALAGYVFFYMAADELHVMNIAVHPEFRQKNLATELLTHIHQIAKKKKMKYAYLEVRETNIAAHKLYEKLGYQKQGRRVGYYSNQEDAFLMYKEF